MKAGGDWHGLAGGVRPTKKNCKAASLVQKGGVDLDAAPAYERRPNRKQVLDRRNRPAGRGSTSGDLAMAQTGRNIRGSQIQSELDSTACAKTAAYRLAVATVLNKTVQARNLFSAPQCVQPTADNIGSSCQQPCPSRLV